MKRTAKAHWTGNLNEGKGEISSQSTVLNQTPYSFKTRFESGIGTNPEELIAAAHAGCFTMSVSATLERAGFLANDLNTEATLDLDMANLMVIGIHLDEGFARIGRLFYVVVFCVLMEYVLLL